MKNCLMLIIYRHQIVILLSYLLSLWINLSKTWLWNDICIIYHVKIVIMRPNFDFTLVCLRVVIFGVEHHDFNVILYQIVLIWAALLNPLACIRMSHISTLFIDKCEIPLFGQLLPLYTIFVVIFGRLFWIWSVGTRTSPSIVNHLSKPVDCWLFEQNLLWLIVLLHFNARRHKKLVFGSNISICIVRTHKL